MWKCAQRCAGLDREIGGDSSDDLDLLSALDTFDRRSLLTGIMSANSPLSNGGPPPAKRMRMSPSAEVKNEQSILSPPIRPVEVPETLVPAAETSNGTIATVKASHSSSFRNVSACNRCRLRKNRCDQKLPSCASCEKASVNCVGYDPITKREIPRR